MESHVNLQLLHINKPIDEQDKKILPPRESEDWYDLKYLRPSYDVYIIGDGLKDYTDDIYVRHAEISRCTGIKKDNIISSNQRMDFMSNKIFYKVIVQTLFDFIKMLLPWPNDAFKCGIKSMRAPIDFLKPVILDIDRKFDIKSEKATSTIINAEKYWSITNITRAQYFDQKTNVEVIQNKCYCKFTKMHLLSKAIKKRIQLDITSMSHSISLTPLKLINVCIKDGRSHSEKSCKESNCYRCQSNDHVALNCGNPLKCVNCGGPHLCTSDACVYLVRKSVDENWFVINFLLNEGIITHPTQAFRTCLNAEEYDCYVTDKIDENQILSDKIRTEVITALAPSIEQNAKNIMNLQNTVQMHTQKFVEVDRNFEKLNEQLSIQSNKLDSLNVHQVNSAVVLGEIRDFIKNLGK